MRSLVWAAALCVALWPLVVVVRNPLLEGRDAIWVAGGLAGVLALSLLVFQPLLAVADRLSLRPASALRLHRAVGVAIAAAVLVHVAALYAYSPDDIWDALTLTSPTPFAVYGVIGLWSLVLTIALALTRRWLRLSYGSWRLLHSALAVVIASSGSVHALLIDGAMEGASKFAVVVAALLVTTAVAVELNVLAPLRRRNAAPTS